jgi:predicted lysophospholipase L1 biosynthesis ABC-type transport system permease subunit
VIGPRGPLAARRATAHWVVLAAAALTTLVAAAVGAALAVFAGQGLPQAVRHDLSVAPGTSLSAQATLVNGRIAPVTAALRSTIGSAIQPVPFGFWQATWSDPLGLVPGALPATPASTGKGNTPVLEAAAMEGATSRAVLVSGRWPAAGAASVQAALPATAATLLHVSVGDTLRLRDRNSGALVTFTITGLFAQRQLAGQAASYWELNTVPAAGAGASAGFTTYGPLLVDQAEFPATLAVGGGSWVAQPDMGDFTGTDLAGISSDLTALRDSLANSSLLNPVDLTTSLDGVLAATASDLAVARSLLVISALQLLVLTGAALLAVARLLVTQREDETALLAARGATRWQLTRLTAAEIIPLCGAAAIAGGIAGIWLARLLDGTLHSGAAGIDATAARTWLEALGAAIVVAAVAIASMLAPVLRSRPGTARVRRGRQAVIAAATKAGADLALLVLAVLAGWQLRRYSAVTTTGGNGATVGVDPVLALAPALALAGGTVFMLRLLPAAARAGNRLAAHGRKLTAPMAGWRFSRQPLRQGGAALLLVMAVATGTLALAQHQSWARSAGDQAAFTAGADVRLNLPAPLPAGGTGTVTHAPGVRDAMAVAIVPVALPSEIVAVGAGQAPGVVLLRGDQSALPPGRLFAAIAPAATSGGTVIGGRPRNIQVTATVTDGQGLGAFTATVTITDATGAAYQIPAGTLPADGRPHLLTARLGGTRASYPLRLTQITLGYTLPATPARKAVTLTVSGARFGGWTTSASSSGLAVALSAHAAFGSYAHPRTTGLRPAGDGATLSFTPGYGQAVASSTATHITLEPLAGELTLTAGAVAPAIVPAIATKAFADANNVGVGAVVPATIEGVQVPVTIVAEASAFPTVTGSALVVDLLTLEGFLTSHGAFPLPVTQWWLATANHDVPATFSSALAPGSGITSRAELAAATAADPLSAAPQQALLAIAVAAALLAVTGFWVSIAANVRQRRAENALLAALGVGQRSAATQLFLEKLLISVPSAVLGLVLGTVVARLLVPAVTLNAAAQQPVPPPVTLFDLAQTVPFAAFIAVAPALAAALVVLRRPDPAAELRAAEAA